MKFARLFSSAITLASLAVHIARADAAEPIPRTTPAPVPMRRPAADAPRHRYVRFISVGLNLAPRVYNEFDPGDTGKTTQTIRGAAEYGVTLFGKYSRRFVEIEYQRFQYPHLATGTCCVSVIGGNGSAYVNPANLTEDDIAIHSSIVGIGHTYLATSFLTHGNDYGYPNLESSFGLGIERLPDLSRPFTFFANGYYYPEVHGDFVTPAGRGLELRYKVLTYEAGLVVTVPHSPLFLQIGDLGNRYTNKQNAPVSATHNALTLSLGRHF